MFLKVLDMCDIRAQGSMPSAQPGMLAVSRRRKVPSGRLGMLHGSLEASKAKQPLAIAPGMGRAASSAQALLWYIKESTPQNECKLLSPARKANQRLQQELKLAVECRQAALEALLCARQ
ncbi:hypothetical protein CVIRNUC_000299 [Coccomyxa viridis]|uniref:Uncharacterized protein n=1 Tax=Coccomyxa viridis TaxID=1274662 RepID=A0AAV1HSM0_9CHLO|nr:hypothetical protein CVIRNUC_000299 [Coccomyxa viridis]